MESEDAEAPAGPRARRRLKEWRLQDDRKIQTQAKGRADKSAGGMLFLLFLSSGLVVAVLLGALVFFRTPGAGDDVSSSPSAAAAAAADGTVTLNVFAAEHLGEAVPWIWGPRGLLSRRGGGPATLLDWAVSASRGHEWPGVPVAVPGSLAGVQGAAAWARRLDPRATVPDVAARLAAAGAVAEYVFVDARAEAEAEADADTRTAHRQREGQARGWHYRYDVAIDEGGRGRVCAQNVTHGGALPASVHLPRCSGRGAQPIHLGGVPLLVRSVSLSAAGPLPGQPGEVTTTKGAAVLVVADFRDHAPFLPGPFSDVARRLGPLEAALCVGGQCGPELADGSLDAAVRAALLGLEPDGLLGFGGGNGTASVLSQVASASRSELAPLARLELAAEFELHRSLGGSVLGFVGAAAGGSLPRGYRAPATAADLERVLAKISSVCPDAAAVLLVGLDRPALHVLEKWRSGRGAHRFGSVRAAVHHLPSLSAPLSAAAGTPR